MGDLFGRRVKEGDFVALADPSNNITVGVVLEESISGYRVLRIEYMKHLDKWAIFKHKLVFRPERIIIYKEPLPSKAANILKKAYKEFHARKELEDAIRKDTDPRASRRD